MLEIQVSIETLQLSSICLNSTWMGDHLRTPGGTGTGSVQILMLLRGEQTVSVLQTPLQSKNLLSLLNQVNKRILTWRFSCGNGFCVVWDFSFSTQGFAKKKLISDSRGWLAGSLLLLLPPIFLCLFFFFIGVSVPDLWSNRGGRFHQQQVRPVFEQSASLLLQLRHRSRLNKLIKKFFSVKKKLCFIFSSSSRNFSFCAFRKIPFRLSVSQEIVNPRIFCFDAILWILKFSIKFSSEDNSRRLFGRKSLEVKET